MNQNRNIEFTDYAKSVLLNSERAGGICSWCGGILPDSYCLILNGWNSRTKEVITPTMRLCWQCFDKLTKLVAKTEREQKLL